MNWSRVLAIASAVVATAGLLFLGWSPTTVLALYWVETAVLVLSPWLVVMFASAFTPRDRGGHWGGVLVGLLPLVVLGALLAVYGYLILMLGALRPIDVGDGVTVIGAHEDEMLALLTGLFTDVEFVACALGIVVLTAWDLYARGGAPGGKLVPLGRLAILHLVLGIGATLIAVLQLPAAAALLLVAVKLVLDLRRSRRAATAPVPAPGAA